MLLALGLILQGLYYPVVEFLSPGPQGKIALLGAVGYVIIAIAVFDVAKFLVEEEVLNRREKQTASDARRSLTKFDDRDRGFPRGPGDRVSRLDREYRRDALPDAAPRRRHFPGARARAVPAPQRHGRATGRGRG